MIGDAEFQAGERLRADFWFAGLTPRVTTNWSAVGGSGRAGPGLGLELKDNIVAARARASRAGRTDRARRRPHRRLLSFEGARGRRAPGRLAGTVGQGRAAARAAAVARHYGLRREGEVPPGRARAPLGRVRLSAHARAAEPLNGHACAHAAPASAWAARASERMRSTIDANPFERCKAGAP